MAATQRADVLVLGLGAMGSAVCAQLASRGTSVIGIDQYDPPHPYGSTHGETRMTRLAVGEGRRVRAAGPALTRALARDRVADRDAAADPAGRADHVAPGELVLRMRRATSRVGLRSSTRSSRRPSCASASRCSPSRSETEGYYEPAAGFVNGPRTPCAPSSSSHGAPALSFGSESASSTGRRPGTA